MALLSPRGLGCALLLLASACAPPVRPAPAPAPAAGLPAIPAAEGALDIRVVHPTPTTPRPNVDSTYIYGSVGTGRAELTIDGTPVDVQPNGAFLAYLPVPQSGAYQLIARAGGRTATATAPYRVPAPPSPAEPSPAAPAGPTTTELSPARAGRVTGGADTLATGSEVAIGRPAPGGTYRWFLPRGARLRVTGRRGDLVRVQLDTATAWFPAADVTVDSAAAPPTEGSPLGPVRVEPAPGWVDVRIPAGGAPFLVRPERDRVAVTVYGRASPAAATPASDPMVADIRWAGAGPATAEIQLARPLWGYKAFYAPDGDLVLRLRRPPAVDPTQPLRGRRIAIDPGHPPGGATGPTGLTEGEANLAVSLRLAEQLRQRGAEVLLTRSENRAVGLTERVQMAVDWNADLLVSVHNNAFAEGVNPYPNAGTSVYYFQPFSEGLARSLNREIVDATRVRDLGARWSNLALARPTWMPSALTESLFMLIPQHEAALRDPAFLDRLAAAHVRGIENFLAGTR